MNKIREIVDQSRIGYLVDYAQRVKRDIIFIYFVTYYLHVFIKTRSLFCKWFKSSFANRWCGQPGKEGKTTGQMAHFSDSVNKLTNFRFPK